MKIRAPLELTGNIVMTPYGEHRLCRYEEWAFEYVYGTKWQDEIYGYASALTEEQEKSESQ